MWLISCSSRKLVIFEVFLVLDVIICLVRVLLCWWSRFSSFLVKDVRGGVVVMLSIGGR